MIGEHPEKYHNYSKEEVDKIKGSILKKINFNEIKGMFSFFEYIKRVNVYEEDNFCLNEKIIKEITYESNEVEKEHYRQLNSSASDTLEYIELALEKRFDIDSLKKDNNYYYYLDIYQEIIYSKKHDKNIIKEVFLEHMRYDLSDINEPKYKNILEWIEENEEGYSINDICKKINFELLGDPIVEKVKKRILKKRKILNFFSIKSSEDEWMKKIESIEKNEVSLYSKFNQVIILESEHYNLIISMKQLFANAYGYSDYSNIVLGVILDQVKLLSIPIDTYTHFRDDEFNHFLIKTKKHFLTYSKTDQAAKLKNEFLILHDKEDDLEHQLIQDMNHE